MILNFIILEKLIKYINYVKNVEKISRGEPEKDKLQFFVLYVSGLSMNRIAQRFGVSASAVLKGGTL
ncbi:helix-turn-helix domain-containing protein [Holospora undulata]|uniref:Uncharacterized protein n=1 Tax=Holospora undulata HU1 TaxID=1321371 RepID=A0A061JIP6_9PROT|nr:helix-turn-helix domain-containing protein [Holospora undulata]ETZ05508.1 hypothetical protein K737_300055 [Holospora undulata HU1]